MRRVLVVGGTGFLGYRVVRALLDEGADVTVLIRPDQEDKLGVLRNVVRLVHGDVWNPGSLRGRGRGQGVVIHLIGGAKPNAARGLTFRHLNFVSTRNVAQMAVNDGVPHMMFLSAAGPLHGAPGSYIESKREAERYLHKSGLNWTILYAPPLYAPSEEGVGLVLRLMSLFGRGALAADTAARAIARLAVSLDVHKNRLIRPLQLRQIGRLAERRLAERSAALQSGPIHSTALDEPPFGWLPPPPPRP